MTHLTVDPGLATVIAVACSQSVSRGTSLDWRPIMAPSPVAAGGGVLASGWMGLWMDHGYVDLEFEETGAHGGNP